MYGLRLTQAPEPQNAPELSAVNDCATSGALPPRLAAMILSSLMPPTTRTFTPGWSASKSFTASLKTLSSRWVKPTHSVMLAGSSLAGAFFAGVLASPESPPPPQPTTPADTSSAVAAAVAIRFILSSSPSKEPFPDATVVRAPGRSQGVATDHLVRSQNSYVVGVTLVRPRGLSGARPGGRGAWGA